MMRSIVLLVTLLAKSQTAMIGYSHDTSSNTGTKANQLQPYDSNVDISKEIFSFSPAAEQSEDFSFQSDVPTISRNHIKVMFIRTPEYPNITKSLANLFKINIDRKSIIYVLDKQIDLSDLTQKLHEIKQARPSKPEVRFVKYHTTDDADTVVRFIQNQYASLGSVTHNHGGEIAPVVEFRSRLTCQMLPPSYLYQRGQEPEASRTFHSDILENSSNYEYATTFVVQETSGLERFATQAENVLEYS